MYHLESVRIDQNVDGALLDRVTVLPGGEDNTSLVFITTINPNIKPRNITVRNSRFGNHSGYYNVAIHNNVGNCGSYTFAYNTFSKEAGYETCTTAGPTWIGNIGTKPAWVGCVGKFVKNVWQSLAPSACGTDKWVEGPNFSTSAIGLNADMTLRQGSPAINAGEVLSGTAYCGALGAESTATETQGPWDRPAMRVRQSG